MRFRLTWIPAAFIAALALIVISQTAQSQEKKKPLTRKQVGEYMRKGDNLVKDGKLAEGGRYYYTIAADYPDNGEAQLKLGRLYKELGEIENSAGAYALAAEAYRRQEAGGGVCRIDGGPRYAWEVPGGGRIGT